MRKALLALSPKPLKEGQLSPSMEQQLPNAISPRLENSFGLLETRASCVSKEHG